LAASHHLLLSHGWATAAIRASAPAVRVGITLNLQDAMPASDSEADREACRHFDGGFNRWFLDPLFGRGYPRDMLDDHARCGILPRGMEAVRPGDLEAIAAPLDLLGINYYTRDIVRSTAISEAENAPRTLWPPPAEELTQMGWEVWPEGLSRLLLRVHREYRPEVVYVTENGAAYGTAPGLDGRVHDVERVAFLHAHFAAAHRAVQEGVPLSGFFVWSLLDNFEWERGYEPRFGIVYTDYESGRRIPKDSAQALATWAAQGGLPEALDPQTWIDSIREPRR
jgi:beta-glucosidase